MPMPRGTGWAAREAAAKAKLAAGMSDQLAENLRNAGEQLQAEREAVAAAQAGAARKRAESSCPCPSCDGGKKVLSVDEAAFIASAVEFYRNHRYAIDPEQVLLQYARIANPGHVVVGKRLVASDAYRNDIDLGAAIAAQAPLIPAVQTGTAEEADALAEAVETTKKPRRIVPPPHLFGE